MQRKKYVYWQDGEIWLGYLEEYPDYWTQGETEDELRENLIDIYRELTIDILYDQAYAMVAESEQPVTWPFLHFFQT